MTVKPWPIEREFDNVLRFPERPIRDLDVLMAARTRHRRPGRIRAWWRRTDRSRFLGVPFLLVGLGVWIHFLAT